MTKLYQIQKLVLTEFLSSGFQTNTDHKCLL